MKILFDTDNEQLLANIQHWFKELEYRVYNSGVEFHSDDLVAIKEIPYIIVMANITITDYDDDLTPFQRKNVTLEYWEQQTTKPNQWATDSGRYLWESNSNNLKLTIYPKVMPIYRPDLIVMLNEDGTLFKDGSHATVNLQKLVMDNQAIQIQNSLDDIMNNLKENSKTLEL